MPFRSAGDGPDAPPTTAASGEAATLPRRQGISELARARREVMHLLSGIRQAMGLSRAAMAAQLTTTPNIIAALEAGDLKALPAWPETRRIVDMWVAGAGLDPRPALAGLALVLEPRKALAALSAKPSRASYGSLENCGQFPHIPPHGAEPGGGDRTRNDTLPAGAAAGARDETAARRAQISEPVASTLQRVLTREFGKTARLMPQISALLAILIGLPSSRAARWASLVVVIAVLATTAAQTQVVAAALSKLPAPAERAVRSISEFFAVRFAPVREGHRWIEVEDPRSRRGDKLRIGRHSD